MSWGTKPQSTAIESSHHPLLFHTLHAAPPHCISWLPVCSASASSQSCLPLGLPSPDGGPGCAPCDSLFGRVVPTICCLWWLCSTMSMVLLLLDFLHSHSTSLRLLVRSSGFVAMMVPPSSNLLYSRFFFLRILLWPSKTVASIVPALKTYAAPIFHLSPDSISLGLYLLGACVISPLSAPLFLGPSAFAGIQSLTTQQYLVTSTKRQIVAEMSPGSTVIRWSYMLDPMTVGCLPSHTTPLAGSHPCTHGSSCSAAA